MRVPSGARVLLIPADSGTNPYIRLLSEGLETQGLAVQALPWMTLEAAAREVGLPDIVHLQWQHRFLLPVRGKGMGNAVRRTLALLRQVGELRSRGVKFVWTVHNTVNHEGRYERWERFACRLLARRVDLLLVHCEAAAERVSECYGVSADRIRVLPHGNYISHAGEYRDRADARRSLALPAEARVLAFFGQIRGYKGVEELAQAFVANGSPNAVLVIAGWLRDPGLGERLELMQRSDDRLRLRFEFLPDEAVVDLIRASDAVVLPYLKSLTSGSAVLAASCGRPVVAPRLGCLAEWPDETGVFFDPAEPGALEGALSTACETGELDQRGQAALAYVAGNDWETIARQLAGFYHAVLEDGEHGSGEA